MVGVHGMKTIGKSHKPISGPYEGHVARVTHLSVCSIHVFVNGRRYCMCLPLCLAFLCCDSRNEKVNLFG